MSDIPQIIDGQLSRKDAVNFVAGAIYPDEDKRLVRKRVRERIRYGVELSELHISKKTGEDLLDAAEFFDWAKHKWPALRRLPGLPTRPIGASLNIIATATFSASAISAPSELELLRDKYIETATTLHETEKELSKCKNELSDLSGEVRKWREKDRQTRERKSAAGKLGRGASRRRR